MSNTVATSPGTMADDDSVGSVSWSNPNNAKVSDNVYTVASFVTNYGSHYLKATNFGFSIPTGATINGIVAEIEGKYAQDAGTGNRSHLFYIVKGNVIEADSKGVTLTTADTYVSAGSSNDLWNQTWTPVDINASDFGVAFKAIALAGGVAFTTSVDHIRITVYYTETSNIVGPFPTHIIV